MKILLAEDDSTLRRNIKAKLVKWGHKVVAADNFTDVIKVFRSNDLPQVAILGWNMCDRDGTHLCSWIRNRFGDPYIYVILLVNEHENENVVEITAIDADDFIKKPFEAHELKIRLFTAERILNMHRELDISRESIKTPQILDSLTGLYNRAVALDMVRDQMAHSKREKKPLSVILMDIDDFHHINEKSGHAAGDRVLVETASRITDYLRPYDIIVRYGGDEFLLVTHGNDISQAVKLAERIRSVISETPCIINNTRINISASFGVAEVQFGKLESAEMLLNNAGMAIFIAKSQGHNCIEAFGA